MSASPEQAGKWRHCLMLNLDAWRLFSFCVLDCVLHSSSKSQGDAHGYKQLPTGCTHRNLDPQHAIQTSVLFKSGQAASHRAALSPGVEAGSETVHALLPSQWHSPS